LIWPYPRMCSGDGGDFHREPEVFAVQAIEQLGHRHFVFHDQPPFGPALFGVAEDVQRGAAQSLQLREDPERGHHPGAELGLRRLARARIRLVENRRSEVEFELVASLEHRFDLPGERRIGVQARDFVFVLVGEELEVVARDRLGERGASGLERFGFARALDELAVALGVRGILVRGEEFDPARDQLVEVARERLRDRNDLRRSREPLHPRKIGCGAPSP
jgi:hypothetical protein